MVYNLMKFEKLCDRKLYVCEEGNCTILKIMAKIFKLSSSGYMMIIDVIDDYRHHCISAIERDVFTEQFGSGSILRKYCCCLRALRFFFLLN